MSKSIGGLKAIYITSPQNNDVVALTQISNDSSVTIETIETETTTGAVYGGRISTAEIVAYGSSSVGQKLREWAESDTPVRFSGYGLNEVVYWNEEEPINSSELQLVTNARDGLDRISFRIQSIKPFADIVILKNMLKAITRYPDDGKPKMPSDQYRPKRQIESGAGVDNNGTRFPNQAVLNFLSVSPFVGQEIIFGVKRLDGLDGTLTVTLLDVNQNVLAEESVTTDGTNNIVSNSILVSNPATYYIRVRVSDGELENAFMRIDGVPFFTAV